MNYEDIFERLLLLEYKEKGLSDRKIAIYPYGRIGKLTRQVMRNRFNLDNIWCIDNHLKEDGVVTYEEFMKEEQRDVLWILSTERQEVFNQLMVRLFLFGINAKNIFILKEELLLSKRALERMIADDSYRTVLDVGCGEGIHGRILEDYGKKVTGLTYSKTNFYQCKCLKNMIYTDFLEYEPTTKYDIVWASHIMEHIADEMKFIRKLKECVREEGCIAITVPARESNILLSHVHSYNAGRVLRFLLCAGIDCREAEILEYGYNLSIIIPNIHEIPELIDARKIEYREIFDAENILHYLPKEISLRKAWGGNTFFNGDIREIN